MKTIYSLLGAIVLLALSFFSGRLVERQHYRNLPISEKTDTVIIRDTIRPKVKETTRYFTKWEYIAFTDTITMRDTVRIPIAIESVEYAGPDYRARVSGYHPSLDFIEIYPKTEIVTNYKTEKVKCKWGLGVQVGAGFGNGQPTPYIGLGLSYNILSW